MPLTVRLGNHTAMMMPIITKTTIVLSDSYSIIFKNK